MRPVPVVFLLIALADQLSANQIWHYCTARALFACTVLYRARSHVCDPECQIRLDSALCQARESHQLQNTAQRSREQ